MIHTYITLYAKAQAAHIALLKEIEQSEHLPKYPKLAISSFMWASDIEEIWEDNPFSVTPAYTHPVTIQVSFEMYEKIQAVLKLLADPYGGEIPL